MSRYRVSFFLSPYSTGTVDFSQYQAECEDRINFQPLASTWEDEDEFSRDDSFSTGLSLHRTLYALDLETGELIDDVASAFFGHEPQIASPSASDRSPLASAFRERNALAPAMAMLFLARKIRGRSEKERGRIAKAVGSFANEVGVNCSGEDIHRIWYGNASGFHHLCRETREGPWRVAATQAALRAISGSGRRPLSPVIESYIRRILLGA